MKKILGFVLFTGLFFSFLFFIPTSVVHGQNCPLGQIEESSGGQTMCLPAGTGTSTTAACDALAGIGKILCQIHQLLNQIVPILVALGLVYFVWNVVQYVIADGEEAKKKGKDGMIYGIIGFAVIVGLWGLVNIVVATFSLQGATPPAFNVNGASGTCTLGTTFADFVKFLTCNINTAIIPLMFAVAVAMFVWGVINFFIINADEEAKRAQGKQFIIWGIIALAVMLTVWGLVGIFGSTFGLDISKGLPHVTPP